MHQKHSALIAAAAAIACTSVNTPPLYSQTGPPSRPAVKGCTWERASDKLAGLAVWVQRCDFGKRKVQLFFRGNTVVQQFSDGGAPDAVIEVFDLQPSESVQNGVQRIYLAHTKPDTSIKCIVAPYKTGKAPADVQRLTFVPNILYERALKVKANPNEVPEPPCGAWGTAPDGIQYFQVWPTSTVRKVVFVRVGQDEPLFDEQTMQLIPPANAAGAQKS